ncbi:hypothetical protein PVAP13_5KG430907 [Panicum virgatum]|uniref:Uncharacterized protein n=1 Tax=Panicum virgatum TaxID=38727 RepID=A0A8T0SRP4_PANVG|nr:hypothetical protein PVAP13_5KG430907 [Panicum virgatum]
MHCAAEQVDEGDENEHPVRQDQVQKDKGGERGRRHGGRRTTRFLLLPRGAERLEDDQDAEQRGGGRPRPGDAPRVHPPQAHHHPPDRLEHLLAVHARRTR